MLGPTSSIVNERMPSTSQSLGSTGVGAGAGDGSGGGVGNGVGGLVGGGVGAGVGAGGVIVGAGVVPPCNNLSK